MKNDFEIRGDVTAIFLNSKKYGKMETLISTCDLPKAQELENSWFPNLMKLANEFYVVGYRPMRGRGYQEKVLLHRWITNAPNGLDVDHINHVPLDNTRDNLRIVTHKENMENIKPRKQSYTKVKNVHWHKKQNKYQVSVGVGSERRYIGTYDTIEEAIIQRDRHQFKNNENVL